MSTKVKKHKSKQSSGVQVYGVFLVNDFFDGGEALLSLHKTRAGAEAAVRSGKYTRMDYDIQKYELED